VTLVVDEREVCIEIEHTEHGDATKLQASKPTVWLSFLSGSGLGSAVKMKHVLEHFEMIRTD
jgi:hypothetical protein